MIPFLLTARCLVSTRGEGSDLPNYLLLLSLCPIIACYFSLKPPFAIKIEAVKFNILDNFSGKNIRVRRGQ